MEGEKKMILLDAERMTDRESLHPYLREQMCLPEYYGDNFDALYDVLTDIGCPTQIVLKGGENLEAFGWFGRQVLRVFREAAEDNVYLELIEEAGERADYTSDKLTEKGEDE